MTVHGWQTPDWPVASRGVPFPSQVSALGEEVVVDLLEPLGGPFGVVIERPGPRASRDRVATPLVENEIADGVAQDGGFAHRYRDCEIRRPVGHVPDGRSYRCQAGGGGFE